MKTFLPLLFFSLASLNAFSGEITIPPAQRAFLENYCIDCHDEDTMKGDLDLDHKLTNWNSKESREHWAKLYSLIERGIMPPKKKKQPTQTEKDLMMTWLDRELVKYSPVGGGLPRRLNKREYLNTIDRVFQVNRFTLPAGFPDDGEHLGYDTVGQGLVISPAHLEAYQETALLIADKLLPQKVVGPKEPYTWNIPASELSLNSQNSILVNGTVRMIRSGYKAGTNPVKFEAPYSGTYKITFTYSSKNSSGNSAILGVGANSNKQKIEVKPGLQEIRNQTVTLRKGESLYFEYSNSKFGTKKSAKLSKHMESELNRLPWFVNAWKNSPVTTDKMTWWLLLKEVKKLKGKEMKLKPGTPEYKQAVQEISKATRPFYRTIARLYFNEGPYVAIHKVKITGPYKVTDDGAANQVKKYVNGLTTQSSDSDIAKYLKPKLQLAFRRPVTDSEIMRYVGILKNEVSQGSNIADAIHLVLRTVLITPSFLYKESGQGPLSEYELASRMSYFLSSNPPQKELLGKAQHGSLHKASVRKDVTEKFLNAESLDTFITDFTGQWLDVNLINGITPDPNVFKSFSSNTKRAMKAEVNSTFKEILLKNRPVSDFIDPDFIYTDEKVGSLIYGIPLGNTGKKSQGKKSKNKTPAGDKNAAPAYKYTVASTPTKQSPLYKLAIERGTKKGGLLSMPAVMMATANGVDTQPVLRGVWMLNNILGMPPPEPPQNVPALSTGVGTAETLKEIMAAHQDKPSCIGCHKDIDPLGFVLENFDPVGRWRSHYPVFKTKGKSTIVENGMTVDATGVMPDGTKLKDITDLKKYLVEHPLYLTSCLAEQVLVYATGRPMNYREKKIIKELAANNIKNGNGFKDLLMDIVASDLFILR